MFTILNVFKGRPFVEQVKLQDIWLVNLYTEHGGVEHNVLPEGFIPLEVNVFTELDTAAMKLLLSLVRRPIVRRQRKFTMSDYGVYAGPGEMFDFKVPFTDWVDNVRAESTMHRASITAAVIDSTPLDASEE